MDNYVRALRELSSKYNRDNEFVAQCVLSEPNQLPDNLWVLGNVKLINYSKY